MEALNGLKCLNNERGRRKRHKGKFVKKGKEEERDLFQGNRVRVTVETFRGCEQREDHPKASKNEDLISKKVHEKRSKARASKRQRRKH
jgi:hypothetical protein